MTSMDDYLNKLRAAAEPTRLRLLTLCAQGELTVTELTQILGQSQPRVSRHLKLMVEAGLLDRFREGTWAFYRLVQGEAAGLAHKLIEMIPEDDGTVALDQERLKAIKVARAEEASAYFRKNAAQWDKIRRLYVEESEVETVLLGLLPASGVRDLVDIGTGTGKMLEALGPKVEQAVGIDLSRDMLGMARANLEAAGLRHCQVRHGDMYMLPLASQSADLATIHQVLHYADDPGQVIAEAARVLRPGGRLIVVDFAPHELEFLRTEHAHRRLGFTDAEVQGWFRGAGLVPQAPVRLPGRSLTVVLWAADLPGNAHLAAAAAMAAEAPAGLPQ
jgi:ubiquinone/menaquinone biosynthesis C-methylase UbiE/DNA-binding transcriptional ArsR family regulator